MNIVFNANVNSVPPAIPGLDKDTSSHVMAFLSLKELLQLSSVCKSTRAAVKSTAAYQWFETSKQNLKGRLLSIEKKRLRDYISDNDDYDDCTELGMRRRRNGFGLNKMQQDHNTRVDKAARNEKKEALALFKNALQNRVCVLNEKEAPEVLFKEYANYSDINWCTYASVIGVIIFNIAFLVWIYNTFSE